MDCESDLVLHWIIKPDLTQDSYRLKKHYFKCILLDYFSTKPLDDYDPIGSNLYVKKSLKPYKYDFKPYQRFFSIHGQEMCLIFDQNNDNKFILTLFSHDQGCCGYRSYIYCEIVDAHGDNFDKIFKLIPIKEFEDMMIQKRDIIYLKDRTNAVYWNWNYDSRNSILETLINGHLIIVTIHRDGPFHHVNEDDIVEHFVIQCHEISTGKRCQYFVKNTKLFIYHRFVNNIKFKINDNDVITINLNNFDIPIYVPNTSPKKAI